jgi:hypothetical protein
MCKDLDEGANEGSDTLRPGWVLSIEPSEVSD